ncbi:MAG: NifU family protein [archaeon]
MALKEQIQKVIDEEIKPGLEQDGGSIELINVDEEIGVVKVKLQGACATCPMAQITLKTFVEAMLKEKVPGVKLVESV